jgi:hypothetical protein
MTPFKLHTHLLHPEGICSGDELFCGCFVYHVRQPSGVSTPAPALTLLLLAAEETEATRRFLQRCFCLL